MINECPSKEGDLVHIGSKGKWGITQNNHATLTARIAELEQENAKLLDEVTARRFTDERTDKLLDELEAENKRLREALNTIHKRIMGYEPDNRIEARFFGELKIIARKALDNKAEITNKAE